MLSVHVLALVFMLSQRLVLLVTNWQQLEHVSSKFTWILSALLRGLWFDNVIACYISAILCMILPVFAYFNLIGKTFFRITNVLYTVLYSIVFAAGVADIPYFGYFFKHLNSSIFNWAEERGTAMEMILQEKSYYVYFLFYVVSVVAFGWILVRLTLCLRTKKPLVSMRGWDYAKYVPVVLILIGLGVFGARGRVGYNPIKTSQAYFCDNTFLNELGLNPLFFFINDVKDANEKHFNVDDIVGEKDALAFVRSELGLEGSDAKYPLRREVVPGGEARKLNVVVILMESMSANLLDVEENGKSITPYLHELITKSYYFENFYSAGNHTNHGVMASLFGLPALFDRNMMKNVDIPLCQGLPYTLRGKGYRTMFFMSHESQYDNMNAFLRENGVQEIYAQENYPVSARVNSFGVPDAFLLDYALNKINEQARSGKLFQATVLTISNHPPYIVPEAFRKVSSDPKYQIVAYADHSIRRFMEGAAREPWFKNTVFVLLGDHGKVLGSNSYEMPLSFNHIPLIIYSPAFADAPRRMDMMGGQVDVFPTLMGMLNLAYVNNTFGVDLLKTPRRFMSFSADDGIGCIDKSCFYAYNFKSKSQGFYKYKDNDPKNYIGDYKAKADSMKHASAAMLQAAHYVMQHKLIRVE